MQVIGFLKNKVLPNYPALGNRNFRFFLSGQCISLIGTWMQRVAQQWLIYDMTKSPVILGLVGVCQFTPVLILSLFAGVLADRFPKKKLLILTQSLQMLQAFILAALTWSGAIEYWHILIMASFLGLTHTFDMPTRQSFFIELVGREALVSAIGLNSTVVNLGRIIGPAIGGVLLSAFGATICFLVNGLSFLAVIFGLINIKYYNEKIREKGKNIFHEVIDGLKYIFSIQAIYFAVTSMLIIATIAMNSDVIIPVLAKDVLSQQASGYSLMLTAMGFGSLIASLCFSSRKHNPLGKDTLIKSAALIGIFLILTGVSHNYYMSIVSLTFLGFFNMIFMTTVNSTIQLNSSDEYRGRAMGVYTLVFTGTTPLGNFLTGFIIKKFGANLSFIICGTLSIALILLLTRLRTKSKLENSVQKQNVDMSA